MEPDGVDAEIIYGVLGTASKLNDTEGSNEVLYIYNDWLKDFCGHYPDRQIGLACLPYGSVDLAVVEVHRVAKMGLKGLELTCSWDMEPMWHPSWEPFWKAVDEVGLPLHFHTSPTTPPRAPDEAPSRARSPALAKPAGGPRPSSGNPITAITQLPYWHGMVSVMGLDEPWFGEAGIVINFNQDERLCCRFAADAATSDCRDNCWL